MFVEKCDSCSSLILKTLFMSFDDIMNIGFTKQRNSPMVELFLIVQNANVVLNSWDLSRCHDILFEICVK